MSAARAATSSCKYSTLQDEEAAELSNIPARNCLTTDLEGDIVNRASSLIGAAALRRSAGCGGFSRSRSANLQTKTTIQRR
jgi:hypothetical protein